MGQSRLDLDSMRERRSEEAPKGPAYAAEHPRRHEWLSKHGKAFDKIALVVFLTVMIAYIGLGSYSTFTMIKD
jgi:hypothetical protein